LPGRQRRRRSENGEEPEGMKSKEIPARKMNFKGKTIEAYG